MARRRRGQKNTDDQFSVAPIDLTAPREAHYMRVVTSMTRNRSVRPWQWYNNIGEIHYSVSRNAKVAGYTTLRVVERNPNGTPGDDIKGGFEVDVLDMLSSPYGGTRGFIERFFTMMKVPGDTYLIRCRDDDGDVEGYDWLSAEEIDKSSLGQHSIETANDPVFSPNQPINRILLPGNGGSGNGSALTVEVLAKDFLSRVWRPAGQYVAMADSPMMALDIECEILDLLTKNIRAKLLSRFALNGIFFVPAEIAQIRSGQPSGDPDGQYHDNEVLDRLISAATWAVANHEQPEAAVPIFMTGPGAYGDMIKHITYDRDIMEVDMQLRAELIDRILMGLDNQPSTAKGAGETNHWSAWAATDEERRVNVAPDVEMMCWALTRTILWPEMKERGLPAGRINNRMVWYDMSAASAKTNMAEDVRQLRDRLLISDDGARRHSGVPESDKPTDVEYIRMVGIEVDDPYLATFGLEAAGSTDGKIDWDKVAKKSTPGPEGDVKGTRPKTGPGVGDPGSPNDNKSKTPRRNRPS